MTDATEVLGKLRDADPVPDTDRVHGDDDASALFSSILLRKDEMMDVRERTRSPQPLRPGSGPRRRALVLAASALAAIVAVAVPVALLRGGDPEPEAPVGTAPPVTATTTIEAQPGTPTPDVAPVTVPAEPPQTTVPDVSPTTEVPSPAPDASWARVPDLDVFAGKRVSDIASYGSGFVAVGKVPGDPGNPTVWISSDGLDWRLVPDNAGVFDEQMMGMLLSRFNGGLILIGNGFADDAVFASAAWISDDGVSWTRIPDDSALFDGGSIAHLAAGGPGVVAIGDDGRVLTSTDGLTWSHLPGVFAPGSINDLTAGGPGLVAVGSTAGDGNDAGVWVSSNGVTWTSVDDVSFGGPGNQWMDAVTSGPGGLVAVGTSYTEEGGARGAVWTSTDGFTWTRVPDDAVFEALLEDTAESTMNLFDVAAGGPGYVAVGAEAATEQSVILVSSDAMTWTRVPPSEVDIWVSSILVESGPAGVLVAGDHSVPSATDALVDMWILAP